jgi:hypothetical protein
MYDFAPDPSDFLIYEEIFFFLFDHCILNIIFAIFKRHLFTSLIYNLLHLWQKSQGVQIMTWRRISVSIYFYSLSFDNDICQNLISKLLSIRSEIICILQKRFFQ